MNERLWSVILLLFGVGVLLVQSIDYINFSIDDVFITLRVAQNAANGVGLVYNPGEYVEGFSNMLFTLLLAAVATIVGTSYEQPFTLLWIAKGLSYLSGLLAVYVTYVVVRRRTNSTYYAVLAVLTVVGTGHFVLWMCGGLEGTFYALQLMLIVLVVEQYRSTGEPKWLTILAMVLVAMSITRPEPVIHSLAVLGVLWVSVRPPARREVITRAVVPFLLLFTGFLVWRYAMYGDLLPNTYYAKTGGGITSYFWGGKYLLEGMIYVAGPLLIAIPFAIARKWEADMTVRIATMVLLSTAIFVLYSGSDWMAGYRFVMPLLPIMAWLGIEGVHHLIDGNRPKRWISSVGLHTGIVLLVIGMALAARQSIKASIQTMIPGFTAITGHSVAWHEEIGRWLRTYAEGKGSIATGEAGIIAYLNPELRLVDLYGLLDKTIAHKKKRGEPLTDTYLFEVLRPDFILLYPKEYSYNLYDYSSVAALSPRLKQDYDVRHRFVSMVLYQRKQALTPNADTAFTP
jgi:arabinofuranosyltransferase